VQSVIVLVVFEFSLQRSVEVFGREVVIVKLFFELVESQSLLASHVWVDVSFDLLLIAWLSYDCFGVGLVRLHHYSQVLLMAGRS
jgi:hypothetical protein